MKRLTKPTSTLPNGKLILDNSFVSELVDAVNGLADALEALRSDVSSIASGTLIKYKGLSDRLGKLEKAVPGIAGAVDTLLGGN